MHSGMAKGASWAEATSNSEKIQNIASSYRQAVSQSLKKNVKFILKFHSNFLKVFFELI